ncbi:hypothetical protein D3C81_1516120 [compost metagenome]
MFFLGILATYAFEWIKEEVKSPYYLYETEVISDKKVLTRIKIGNSGQKELDFSSIISKPSIVLIPNHPIGMDSVKILKATRKELSANFKIETDLKNSISINLLQEAFEKNDYVVLGLYQRTYSPAEWKLQTRIIGDLSGFANYTHLFKNTSVITVAITFIVLIFLLILFRYLITRRRQQVFTMRLWEILFLTALFVLSLFYIYVYFKVSQHLL